MARLGPPTLKSLAASALTHCAPPLLASSLPADLQFLVFEILCATKKLTDDWVLLLLGGIVSSKIFATPGQPITDVSLDALAACVRNDQVIVKLELAGCSGIKDLSKLEGMSPQ